MGDAIVYQFADDNYNIVKVPHVPLYYRRNVYPNLIDLDTNFASIATETLANNPGNHVSYSTSFEDSKKSDYPRCVSFKLPQRADALYDFSTNLPLNMITGCFLLCKGMLLKFPFAETTSGDKLFPEYNREYPLFMERYHHLRAIIFLKDEIKDHPSWTLPVLSCRAILIQTDVRKSIAESLSGSFWRIKRLSNSPGVCFYNLNTGKICHRPGELWQPSHLPEEAKVVELAETQPEKKEEDVPELEERSSSPPTTASE